MYMMVYHNHLRAWQLLHDFLQPLPFLVDRKVCEDHEVRSPFDSVLHKFFLYPRALSGNALELAKELED